MRALLLTAVVACSPPGLVLDVIVEADTERVELFVGDYCDVTDCPSSVLVPDIGRRPVTGAYLITDARPWTVMKSQFVDGIASFRLETAHDQPVGIVVAAAYDGQGQITASATFHDVKIPIGDAVRWEVHLDPTLPAAATITQQPPGTVHIKTWQGPSMTRAACLLVEHWTDGAEPIRDLVVPRDDKDCDEVAMTVECAEWTNNATAAAPSILDASCVTYAELTNGVSVCALGGPQCFENGQSGDPCVALAANYCAPAATCLCKDVTDPSICLVEQVKDGIASLAMPHLQCAIPLDGNGVPCGGQKQFEIDAGIYVSSGGSTKCTDMHLTELALPLAELDYSLALAANDAAYLKLANFTSCKADLVWGGTAMAPHEVFGAVDIVLDNGNHLVVPMHVELGTDCGTQAGCSFVRPPNTTTNETIWSCVAYEPPTYAMCPPAIDHNCTEGVWCDPDGTGNGTCCAYGERCGANGCTCGNTGTRCGTGYRCDSSITGQYPCGETCCSTSSPPCI